MLERRGDETPLGKDWVRGFLSRNPEVKTKLGKRIDRRWAEVVPKDDEIRHKAPGHQIDDLKPQRRKRVKSN
ncbi:hypothetical protein ACRE_067130 [Hapsidospora chrysogenum ATCC 11550]|uniref:HTH CENPB-type domain-containing protein n=1 Tax=Hapsidospora chrysogenum (strain ATCC 11550 / CBS 779.69 / DSM 880 / IAM 14645 / JCM 23072 / IMI 49137) TaxID=857340 RepID=A0A086SZK6_HAPC1|nr:hypothetical protein ACRE_067130 [Hapsidospora chrysogenum ATCC 11550]